MIHFQHWSRKSTNWSFIISMCSWHSSRWHWIMRIGTKRIERIWTQRSLVSSYCIFKIRIILETGKQMNGLEFFFLFSYILFDINDFFLNQFSRINRLKGLNIYTHKSIIFPISHCYEKCWPITCWAIIKRRKRIQ